MLYVDGHAAAVRNGTTELAAKPENCGSESFLRVSLPKSGSRVTASPK
jgi:hypothetical protein